VKLIFKSAVEYYKMGRGGRNWIKISHERMQYWVFSFTGKPLLFCIITTTWTTITWPNNTPY